MKLEGLIYLTLFVLPVFSILSGQQLSQKEQSDVKALVLKNPDFENSKANKDGYDFIFTPHKLHTKEKEEDPEGCATDRCVSVTFGKIEGGKWVQLQNFSVIVNMITKRVYVHL